jgi:hypothetical protein
MAFLGNFKHLLISGLLSLIISTQSSHDLRVFFFSGLIIINIGSFLKKIEFNNVGDYTQKLFGLNVIDHDILYGKSVASKVFHISSSMIC